MYGSGIIKSANPQGKFLEGYIYGTPKPGIICQIKAGTAAVNGRFTYEPYAPGSDGKRACPIVLLPDHLQGKTETDAYVSGTRAFFYVPIAGEELNMLVADVSGTADDHAIGDKMIVDNGTGKLVVTTGSPESEPFQLLEAATDPAADALMLCMYTGV